MKVSNVRIKSMEIVNFKNVEYGKLDFDNKRKPYKSSVLGLYGQNGSGKTALIDALYLLDLALSGQKIPVKFADFINVGAGYATLKFNFSIVDDVIDSEYNVAYEFSLRKDIDELAQNAEHNFSDVDVKYKAVIFNEVISSSYKDTKTKTRVSTVVDTRTNDVFVPKNKYNVLVGKSEDVRIDLLSTKKLTAATSRSFVFSMEFLKVLRKNCKEECYVNLFNRLSAFGKYELFVINTDNAGLISMNLLPLSFAYDDGKTSTIGRFPLKLSGSTLIPKDSFKVVEKVIESMNVVLTQLVPGLSIGIKDLGTELLRNGKAGARIQLVSYKNSEEIPLKYESEGIKKLISILHLLIVVYNDPSVTVAVDELDSGVFEYLLGELLKIISEQGKGQLIFTSHNLRPLETIDKGFVAFTTTNPNNRYIRFSNVKTNNNLRDFYYRDIVLGEQNECVYELTNNSEIALAFREAGEISGA